MNEIYGIQLLLQSKNPLLFNKTEKIRFGNLLQESTHFKLAIGQPESKKNIFRLYKYVIMKKYSKNQFIYHKIDPDNHLYIILKGKVACFVPTQQASLLGVIQWSNEGQKFNGDNTSYKYINKDDEDLLNSDLYYSHVYFNGNNCVYKKIKILTPGEAFGGYTQYHEATFIATEDTTVIILPKKKYEFFFQPESYRFNFVNRHLAEMLCKNEQNVRLLLQEEEKLSQIIQQGNNPNSSPTSPQKKKESANILDTVFSHYVSQQKSTKQKDKSNKIEEQIRERQISSENNQMLESAEERKLNESEQNNSQIFEEKKQSLEMMLRCSELSFHFELHKFELSGYVYNENDIVDYYYLISFGKMLLKKSGLQEPIKEYSEGDFLGFEDDNSKRIFSCYAEADTIVYRILKRDFEMNINNNIFSFFKQLQRYKKKQYIEIYKEMKENGLIRGLHRKVKSLNSRDIQYKLQLKKQIAQEILDFMQNAKFSSAKNNPQTQIVTSNNQGNQNNFYEINNNQMSNIASHIGLSLNSVQNSSQRQRSTLSMHNSQEKNSKNVRFNIEQDTTSLNKKNDPNFNSAQQMHQPQLQAANSVQKFSQLSNPLKIQHAQRMVMDQIKKTAQQLEEDKKKQTISNNFNRNVDIQFKTIDPQKEEQIQQDRDLSPLLRRNIFSSQSLHRSSTLNRNSSIDLQGLSPNMKYTPQKQEITPINNNRQTFSPSPSVRNSDMSSSNPLFIPLRGSQISSVNIDQDLSTIKNSFTDYKKLLTFSNLYHQKKNIIQMSPLNVQRNTKKERKHENEEPEIIKSNQNQASVKSAATSKAAQNQKKEPELDYEIDEMQEFNLENPEWLLETAKRIKDVDVGKIKNNIERQILSIPKQYQDKLWGQQAYKSVFLKFQSQK
ncbi:hypothetical protein ABPG74_012556 [Tetrahymena malaccensis]